MKPRLMSDKLKINNNNQKQRQCIVSIANIKVHLTNKNKNLYTWKWTCTHSKHTKYIYISNYLYTLSQMHTYIHACKQTNTHKNVLLKPSNKILRIRHAIHTKVGNNLNHISKSMINIKYMKTVKKWLLQAFFLCE